MVSTPIGNLRDITLRALDVLAGADLVAAEDTRVARKLLSAYGLSRPVESYHDHNADKAGPRILEALKGGAAVALVTDAGTPLVSDPGYRLVAAAADAGVPVYPAPGPSALLAALAVAALPTDRFVFAGFPPAKAGARAAFFAELAEERATLAFFETGPRLPESLAAMSEALGPHRRAAVCRELTKLFEEVRRGALAELADAYREAPRGEIVVVVAGAAPPPAPDDAQLDALLAKLLPQMSLKEAAAQAAAALGAPRKRAYDRALALRAALDGGAGDDGS